MSTKPEIASKLAWPEAISLGVLAGLVVLLFVLVIAIPGKVSLLNRVPPPVALREGPNLTLPIWVDEIARFEGRTHHSVADVQAFFTRIGYDLEVVRWWKEPVPRLFLKLLPEDITSVSEPAARKKLFVSIALPLILQANQENGDLRAKVLDVEWRMKAGAVLDGETRTWIAKIAKQYKIKAKSHNPKEALASLLTRIDTIPADLALAQSAAESGWGTSRFARQGQALFGQWTWDEGAGITPAAREEGKTHSVRAFKTLLDSVRGYIYNLNTSSHYKRFRAARASQRRSDRTLSGAKLARYLDKYSERGTAYIEEIQGLIRSNQLDDFNGAVLTKRK